MRITDDGGGGVCVLMFAQATVCLFTDYSYLDFRGGRSKASGSQPNFFFLLASVHEISDRRATAGFTNDHTLNTLR